MRRRRNLLLLVSALLGVILAVRGHEFAKAPPFELAVELPRVPEFDVHGIALQRVTPAGILEIRAGRLRPGHEAIGFFKLGPSTFLRLDDVEVRCLREKDVTWIVRGSRASMDGTSLRFKRRAYIDSTTVRPGPHDAVRIQLVTGGLSVGR